MSGQGLTFAELARLADRFFLLFLLAAYALAAVFPDAGLRIGQATFGEFALFGDRVRPSVPMLLLAVLLWNAGLSVPPRRLGDLLRRPALLVAGLVANLLVPLGFILGVSWMMRLWYGEEMHGVLVGLGLIAAMPILLVVCYNLVQHLVAGGVDFLRRREAVSRPALEEFSWRVALRPVLSFGFLLLAGVVMANSSAAYWNLRTVAATYRWVAHTQEVMKEIKETLSLLKDAETGQRGNLITGEGRYLEPYEAAVKQVEGHRERLREMTADNAAQKTRTDELNGMIDDHLAELRETIRLRQDRGFEAARAVVLADRGKRRMDEIRTLMGEMEADEERLLERRAKEFDARVGRSLGLVIVAACIVLVSFFVGGLLVEADLQGNSMKPKATNSEGDREHS